MEYVSLYSTRTQNTWRRGLALGNAPDARILRWRYQHVGIFWRYLTLIFVLSPTPNPNASQWNIVCVGFSAFGLALAMYISYFLCPFHLRRVVYFRWNMGLNIGLNDLLENIIIYNKIIYDYNISTSNYYPQ